MPAFAPNAFDLEVSTDWLAVTVPDVQVNPHQSQIGVQIVPGLTVIVFERLVSRRYQPPPPMR